MTKMKRHLLMKMLLLACILITVLFFFFVMWSFVTHKNPTLNSMNRKIHRLYSDVFSSIFHIYDERDEELLNSAVDAEIDDIPIDVKSSSMNGVRDWRSIGDVDWIMSQNPAENTNQQTIKNRPPERKYIGEYSSAINVKYKPQVEVISEMDNTAKFRYHQTLITNDKSFKTSKNLEDSRILLDANQLSGEQHKANFDVVQKDNNSAVFKSNNEGRVRNSNASNSSTESKNSPPSYELTGKIIFEAENNTKHLSENDAFQNTINRGDNTLIHSSFNYMNKHMPVEKQQDSKYQSEFLLNKTSQSHLKKSKRIRHIILKGNLTTTGTNTRLNPDAVIHLSTKITSKPPLKHTTFIKSQNEYSTYFDGYTQDELLDINKGFRRHSFNVSVAYQVLRKGRPIPDTRPKQCTQSTEWQQINKQASIVICFHNEAWPTLTQTIHSAIYRSPPELVKELILVDDASTYDYLKEKLDKYVSNIHKVKLIRSKVREGLIRARLLGTSHATGDVLVFLDSHCECNQNWLKPLLFAVQKKPNSIASPEIDIINPDTFQYHHSPPGVHGGFSWDLQFLWKPLPEYDIQHRKSEAQAIRTPTMIGGLFAVDRLYFRHIGSYDSGMEIWGGENLELSFRVWMCGGSLEIIPCSRVGHIFRRVIPYAFPSGSRRTLFMNAARVANVWMDDYKKFFFATQQFRPPSEAEMPGMRERQHLRGRLQCQDFSWYLRYVIPELVVPTPEDQHYGQVFHKATNQCLSCDKQGVLRLTTCVASVSNQVFHVTSTRLFIHGKSCITRSSSSKFLHLSSCQHTNGEWTLNEKKYLVYKETRSGRLSVSCLTSEIINNASVTMVTTTQCDRNSQAQVWTFSLHFNFTKLHT